MTDLIRRVRLMIADPVGPDMVFADDDIQDALDARRRDVFAQVLRPVETLVAGGTLDYKTFFADGGGWEDDVVIQDSTYATVTPATEDLLVGHWTMSDSYTTSLYLTGKQYDLNAAAADLCDAWLAIVKLDFDFLELGATYKMSQQVTALEALAKKYRGRGWLRTSQMVRTDTLPGWYA